MLSARQELQLVRALLKSNALSASDVLFVRYYDCMAIKTLANRLSWDTHCHHCSFEEFCNAIDGQSESEWQHRLGWVHDLMIVGSDWWVQYQTQWGWRLFRQPLRPATHKAPGAQNLCIPAAVGS